MKFSYTLAIVLLVAPLLLRAQSPAVPPEFGGPGFERIAASMGWETGTISKEDQPYISDVRAIKGGELRFAIGEFPSTFRQYGKDENSAITRLINNMVYESLISVNPLTLEFLPVLASHWKVDSADKQTYWFRIDPNARFSDGHPVTTDDVLATYKLAMDPTILSPYTNSFYDGFEQPEAVSKYIFKVRSKTLNWKNMLYFGGTTVLPAHVIGGLSGKEYLDKYQYDMVPGSGPYIIHQSDVKKPWSFTLTRRTNWWQQEYPLNSGLYNFDNIKIVTVLDGRLILEKFKQEEFDFYIVDGARWWNEELNFNEVQRGIIQKHQIYHDEPVGISGLVFNMRKPPFNDEKVRAAFVHLFNREQLLEKLMYNQFIITDSYFPHSVYANPNNPKYRYDPQKAAQLLAEAGYTRYNADSILVNEKTGMPLIIDMVVEYEMDRIITIVQRDLLRAGIKLNLNKVNSASKFRLLNTRQFELSWMNWGGLIYPNPISSYHSEWADIPNTNNIAGFKNAQADSLMELEQRTYDQPTRIRILQELDSILISSKQYALSWYAPYTRIAYWNRFGHPDFYFGKISGWQSILSTWWVDPKKTATVEKGKKDTTVIMPVEETDVRFWEEWKQRTKKK